MKKFLALTALVLGLASCQTEPEGLDVNVGGAVDTVITVNIPEAETRANNSGIGVFENGVLDGDATMRYIFQVYYNGETNEASRQVKYADGTSVSFPVRLVPGRDYQFVVWADVVTAENAGDNHYNTTDLKNITLSNPSTWVAMDETRDAFTATYKAEKYNGSQSINIDLYRPFAKLRVVTTDYTALANLGTGIKAEKATVAYTTEHRSAFNAYTSEAKAADKANVEHTKYVIAEYTDEEDASRTIFSDYFFAENGDIVKFEMTVYDTNGQEIVTRVFNTDINVNRNYLTTIKGDILTDGNNVNVEVKPGFGDDEIEWPNTPAGELAKAAMFGGEITLTEDIVLDESLNVTANLVINLDGKTITGAFVKDGGALIENNGTLKIVGGTLKNTYTNGDAVINNSGELVLEDVKIEGAPIADGSYPAYAVISSGKMIINDGTEVSADRGCLKLSNGGETVINGGTFVNNDIGSRSLTSHVVDVEDGGSNKLTINGGTFEHRHAATSGGVVICNRTTGTVYVNGGNFSGGNYYGNDNLSDYGYGGTFSVTGGTYTAVPATKYIADGYKAVQSGDKYMVVKEDVGGVATDNNTLTDAVNNAQNGDTIALSTGDYDATQITNIAGKTISFVGNGEDTVFDYSSQGYNTYVSGGNGNFTFENMTINRSTETFAGMAHTNSTVYKNCVINGVYFVYEKSAQFIDCTFNITGNNYNCWLYGTSKATYTNCTFNCDGKSIYVDGNGDTGSDAEFNNCVFNDINKVVTDKAAVETGTTYGKRYELIFNNTTVNGFNINPNGIVTGTTLWANKHSMTADKLKVTVDGYTWVANGLSQKDGEYYVSNANGLNYFSNVTAANGTVIKLAEDIDMNGAEFKAIAAGYSKSLTFDGQNHTIKNVKIATCSHNSVGAAGLFFCYPGGTLNVSNLVVEKATSVGATYAGVITGYTQGNATLTNITVKECNISGVKKIGGIAGFVEASTTNFVAENCKVIDTTVAATEKQAGTIIGYNAKPATLKNCTVENSTATSPQYCDGGVRSTDPAQAELTIE